MADVIGHAFEIAGFVVLIGASVACFWRSRAALAFLGGVLLLLFGHFNRADSIAPFFTSVGTDARLSELNATLVSANASLDHLRRLAANTAKVLIQLRENANASMAGSPADEEHAEDAYKVSLLQNLRDMGVSPAEITAVAQSDSNVVLSFYAYAAYSWGRNSLPERQWPAFDGAYDRITQPANPDDIEKLLTHFHVKATGFSGYMEDYRYYAKKMEQRRPLVWANRASWGFGKPD